MKRGEIINDVKNNSGVILKVKPIALGAEIPSYAYESDVGFDLRANETTKLFPGEQKAVKTGLVFEIPEGHVGLIRDRAGIVQKMGVHTTAGTFDSGFRGEVSIILVNLSEETQYIEQGMRIAQMIIIPVVKPKIIEVEELEDTERGEKGFCSTGMKEIEELKKIMKKKK
jgi:dUTP pyrophosphatase